MMLLVCCDTDAHDSGMKWLESHIAPHFVHDLRNTIVPFLLPLALCDTNGSAIIHLILIILTKQMQWSNLGGHWLHMMLIPMVQHDQKGNVAFPFDHLEITSSLVAFMTHG